MAAIALPALQIENRPGPARCMSSNLSLRNLDDIKTWEENYRVGDVNAIVASIVQFGYNRVLCIWNNTIVAGNHAYLALQQIRAQGLPAPLGIAVEDGKWMVPTVDVSQLSWTKAKAYALADNRTAQLADEDPLRLSELLQEVKMEGLLDAVGYTDEDLDEFLRLASLDPAPEKEENKVSKATFEGEVRFKSGDIVKLGRHRIMCGDSRNPADIAKLMDGRKAKLFATDPPYLVDYTGADRPSQSKDWSDLYKEIEIKDSTEFFTQIFTAAKDALHPRAAWYCWHGEKFAPEITRIWSELGILWHQTIIWVKPCPAMNFSAFAYRHEPCLMGWLKGKKPVMNLLDPQPNTVWECDWDGKARLAKPDHPTQKPTDLFKIPMLKHTKPGDICLELFSGSGTQLIAAEETGRICYAMELEPVFVEVAVRRWEELTGMDAEIVERGESPP